MLIDRKKLEERMRETHRQDGAKLLAALFMVALPGQQIVQDKYYRPATASVATQKHLAGHERAERLGQFIVGDFNRSFQVNLTLTAPQYKKVGQKYLTESPGRALNQIRLFMLAQMKSTAQAGNER